MKEPVPEFADLKLWKWVHMLGFRDHFSTTSRRYSTTLGALRAARRAWRTDATAPAVSNVNAESAVGVPVDPSNNVDPQPLKLGSNPAPAGFDSGDHVNLTQDGYSTISGLFDLSSL